MTMTTTRRTNAEWEATLSRAAHEEWNKLQAQAEAEEVRTPDFYRKLAVTDKARYHGRGCVYNTFGGKERIRNPNCWRIEWSSGRRGTYIRNSDRTAKILYNSLTVWGTYAEARALLDMIVEEPYRPIDEAKEIIEPYIEWRGSTINGLGSKKRVIIGPVPSSSFASPEALRRQQILLDYWRLRTVDTIRLYMELGND
jgi:hypothetical protein